MHLSPYVHNVDLAKPVLYRITISADFYTHVCKNLTAAYSSILSFSFYSRSPHRLRNSAKCFTQATSSFWLIK